MSSAVILNGGKSSRLSVKNKGLLEIRGIPIIKRICASLDSIFDEVIIISNSPEDLKELVPGHNIYRDEVESRGPLSGIYTGLLKIRGKKAFFCACDMPFLNIDLIKYLIRKSLTWDVTCPLFDNNVEPLHSIYSKNCIKYVEELLIYKDKLKVTSLFPMVRTKLVDLNRVHCDTHPYDFLNINTWQDYHLASCIAKQI